MGGGSTGLREPCWHRPTVELEEVFSEHQPILEWFSREQVPGYSRDDLRQELGLLLVNVWLLTPSIDPEKGTFKTYFAGCCKNRIRDLWRRTNREHKIFVRLEEADLIAVHMVPSDELVLDEYRLEGFDRQWVQLRMQGFTWEEVSEYLETPVHELKNYRRRLQNKIRGGHGN